MPVLVAVILGLVTIYLSAIASAIKASRVSPIESLRNTKDIKLSAKKLRTPRFIERLFKTGGVLAYKNLKRSKKKYRTTVISLTISVFIFVAMSSFLSEAFKASGHYYQDYDYNVIVSGLSSVTQENINAIRSLKETKNMYVLYNTHKGTDYLRIDDQTKITKNGDDVSGLTCDDYDKTTYECIGDPHGNIDVYALDDATFRSYTKKLKLDYEKVKEKGILSDTYEYPVDKTLKEDRRYTYKKGDKIEGLFDGKNISIEVALVTDTKAYGLENHYYSGGFLFVNRDYYKDWNQPLYRILIETDNFNALSESIKEINSTMEVNDMTEDVRYEKALRLIVCIFLYGFITVITLIGVTNIFNTITSNMELRQREFAMLKSIGMTKKEFNRMINLETLFYSMKALIYGIALGLIAAITIHNAFGLKRETAFIIPWTSIIISIVFVFIIVKIIMNFSIKKINKQNVIETIRKENI